MDNPRYQSEEEEDEDTFGASTFQSSPMHSNHNPEEEDEDTFGGSTFQSSPMHSNHNPEEEDDDEDTFHHNVSGFGEMEEHNVGEEEEQVEGESEMEESKLDDAQREDHAIHIYQETHPDLNQRYVGGREVAEHEAIWSVSSFRPHWGPDKLRDNNALTYWQSDCPNPKKNHTIDLLFHQATLVRQVSLFIDYFQDESYTPKTISIRGGNTFRDLHEIMTIDCDEIVGWINADITAKNDGDPFRVFRLQIAILNTHLNGRDTHIRQVKVYSVLPSYLQEEGDDLKETEKVNNISRKPINRGLR